MPKEFPLDPDKLSAHRGACGLTQAELAKAIGVSERTVSNWETGTTRPDHAKAGRLREFFNVDISDLMIKRKARAELQTVVSPDVDSAITYARETARTWKDDFISVPHFLVGLAKIKGGLVRSFLAEHGITFARFSGAVRETLKHPKDSKQKDDSLHFTDTLRQVFVLAEKSAHDGGLSAINERSVVLAVTELRADYLDAVGKKLNESLVTKRKIEMGLLRSRVMPRFTPLKDQ